MRQKPVGEPAATAALNFGTPRRRSSLKRLRPFCHCRQRYERNLRRIRLSAALAFIREERLRYEPGKSRVRESRTPGFG
jgi:hypothetical protein